jgi:hypothetical protein
MVIRVHSANSNWLTSLGFNQRHSFIFAAISPYPHRPLRPLAGSRKGIVRFLARVRHGLGPVFGQKTFNSGLIRPVSESPSGNTA